VGTCKVEGKHSTTGTGSSTHKSQDRLKNSTKGGLQMVTLDNSSQGEGVQITGKSLFQHQIDATAKLNELFTFKDSNSKAGILVFPTGAGKTFTTVKWIGDAVLPKNIKVLWLAHTFHLLDQAYETFKDYEPWVQHRSSLNIRRVSSHPSHDKPATIDWTSDDIVLISTQTAISNWETKAVDNQNLKVITNFERFVRSCTNSRLMVVLDEAHHAPAYGCRNLLLQIRETVPSVYFLGLTATPTYTDEKKRGWLNKIFTEKIVYQAPYGELVAQKILATPRFIQMPTGREYIVSDAQYEKLVEQHRDVEEIIQKLADDRGRNDFIVDTYVKHSSDYGKTLMFADRWYQCVYLKDKLEAAGIKTDAIYHHVDADPGSAEARNKRTSDDNKRILEEFKKNNLEVLINVKMLTEGTDVPDIKTVFVTRQTASSILMTQMIGRGLRGEKAGGGPGKSEANIVLFVDDWKRLIKWADPILDGGTEVETPSQMRYPLHYISIRLIEEIVKQINSGIVFPLRPYLYYLPIGWYQTDVTVDTSEGEAEEMQRVQDFVMVYEHTKPKFEGFIDQLQSGLSDDWARERLEREWMDQQADQWVIDYFDTDEDDIGGQLRNDLVKLARHVAQNDSPPTYYAFSQRDQHDLDKLAKDAVDKGSSDIDQWKLLDRLFSEPGSLWQFFYKNFDRFHTAFEGAKRRYIYQQMGLKRPENPPDPPTGDELTEDEKEQILKRDKYTCQACGAVGKRFRLQVDHIIPKFLGVNNHSNNLQTLCKKCNSIKGIQEINFKNYSTQLPGPKEWAVDLQFSPKNEAERASLTRLVNFFYHCQAVCEIRMHKRSSGKYYNRWEIELYEGNNPEWLLRHKAALLHQIALWGFDHVSDITITNAG
jgi:superfamily II DNA or RNA helicase